MKPRENRFISNISSGSTSAPSSRPACQADGGIHQTSNCCEPPRGGCTSVTVLQHLRVSPHHSSEEATPRSKTGIAPEPQETRPCTTFGIRIHLPSQTYVVRYYFSRGKDSAFEQPLRDKRLCIRFSVTFKVCAEIIRHSFSDLMLVSIAFALTAAVSGVIRTPLLS